MAENESKCGTEYSVVICNVSDLSRSMTWIQHSPQALSCSQHPSCKGTSFTHD